MQISMALHPPFASHGIERNAESVAASLKRKRDRGWQRWLLMMLFCASAWRCSFAVFSCQ